MSLTSNVFISALFPTAGSAQFVFALYSLEHDKKNVKVSYHSFQFDNRIIMLTGRFRHWIHVTGGSLPIRASFFGFLACFASFFNLFLDIPSVFPSLSLSSLFLLASSACSICIFFKCSSGDSRTYGCNINIYY